MSHPAKTRSLTDCRPGERLPNGATLIARRRVNPGEYVVLAHTWTGGGEYVTWRCPAFNAAATWAGRYFPYGGGADSDEASAFDQAVASLHERT